MDAFIKQYIEQFTDNLFKLKSLFGWWSLALVFVTFALMLPINFGLKKLFALGKESVTKNRIRKNLSFCLVFVVAGGLIATYLTLVAKAEITFDIIYQGAIPCAVTAMLVNSVYKFIRDTGIEGIKKLIKAIVESNAFKTAVKKAIPDKNLSNVIQSYIIQKTKDIDISDLNSFLKQNTALINDISYKVSGFVENPKLTAIEILTAYVNQAIETKDKTA